MSVRGRRRRMLHDELPPAMRFVLADDLDRHCGAAGAAAELVAVGIAQIGEVELAEAAFAIAGRVLDDVPPASTPAACQASTCSGLSNSKPMVAAIGVSRWFAVDRLR